MNSLFCRSISLIAVTVSIFVKVDAQISIVQRYKLELSQSTANSFLPISNSVTDIVAAGNTIWLGTGKGLSRSTDNGSTWRNYYNTPEFGEEDISAIAVHNNEVWVATAHSTTIAGSTLPEGSGIRYSKDDGESWTILPQPRDTQNIVNLFYNAKSKIRALGVTTNVNNITYDIAATDSAVWITSYAGMARKSTDKGKTWQVVIIPPDFLDSIFPTDSLVFDVSPVGGGLGLENNFNHRAFSVYAENWSNVWIGTAGGINKTTDGGRSWMKFSHRNEAAPISGNFVVALRSQSFGGHKVIWAGTVNAEDSTERRGLSFSQDSGQTWKTALLGEFCHNIGIKDSIAYVVTDNGIFRTSDVGQTWTQPGSIYDKITRQRYVSQKFYSADASGDNVWFGGDDGIISTFDNNNNPFGFEWKVLHASQPLSSSRTTYAYPNPFPPDDEVVRLHYSTENRAAKVTIRIFDFGMNLVRTVISNADRFGAPEFDEIWDGKNDNRRQVSNGPYFYQVVIDNGEPIWGKILVLQ